MTIRIGVNGLGRIGRCILRALVEEKRNDIEVVAVNGTANIKDTLHLLKYDSVHGRFLPVEHLDDNHFILGDKKVRLFQERNPQDIPWKDYGVDVVMECTGKFTKFAEARKHIDAGAKRVIISAPGDNVEATIVHGVNDDVLQKDHSVISIGSCTTNCLASVAKVLNDHIGIKHGFMTTIHAYTNDQNILDGSHKDLRRARACALSMIPTSTGAAKAIGLVVPELAGKLDGGAVRVPTPNVSLVDLTFVASRNTSAQEINDIIMQASKQENFRGILGVCDEPLVSIDFNHSSFSSVFDVTQTKVIDQNLCKVASWYDNEWGFSVRMLDVAVMWCKKYPS